MIFWFDTETTGLDPKIHGLTELAVLIEDNGKIIDQVHYSIVPSEGVVVDPKALEIQGKSLDDLRIGMPEKLVLDDLKTRLRYHIDPYNPKQKFVQAGYNVGFDDSFLREFFIRNNDKYYGSWFFNARIDVLSLVAMCQSKRKFTVADFKLSTMCKHFYIPLDAHHAMDDIKATRELYSRLIQVFKNGKM